MDSGGVPGNRTGRSALLQVLVWLIAGAWSFYLIAAEVHRRSSGFAVVVQLMGSLGILFALFLVMRPTGSEVSDHTPIAGSTDGGESRFGSMNASRWALVTITIALAVGAIAYHLMQGSTLHQSVVFFIGLPAVLAVILSLTPKAKSATGMIVKGITLGLLLSGIVLAEGFVCILMAAPLFYLVGILIGVPIDRVRRRRESEGKVYSVVGVGLLLLSIEGTVPGISSSPHEIVRVTRTVDASVDEVRRSLASTPDFDQPLPFYLKLGFPRPIGAEGHGLAVGDHRSIFFGSESPMEPMTEAHHRDHPTPVVPVLELEVVASEKGRVVFGPTRDATAFTHWISWGRSIVSWKAIDADSTKVTWTLHFTRRLTPSWYFGPFQRYAADKAVGYLIDTVATP